MLPLTTFYRSGAHRSDVYKWDAFVTSWRFYNRAWQPQHHDRLPETSGTLWIHRGALTNQRCSLATGCGIIIKTSVHGSSKFSGCSFEKAFFAARSASSFPLISLWLGIQQNVINLPLYSISWHACKTLFTRGFLLSWLSMACNTDMLSENITKLFLVETFIYVKALLIASTSAVKILQPSLSL